MILAFTLLELEDVESFNSKRVSKLAGPIRLDDQKPWRGPFGAVGWSLFTVLPFFHGGLAGWCPFLAPKDRTVITTTSSEDRTLPTSLGSKGPKKRHLSHVVSHVMTLPPIFTKNDWFLLRFLSGCRFGQVLGKQLQWKIHPSLCSELLAPWRAMGCSLHGQLGDARGI